MKLYKIVPPIYKKVLYKFNSKSDDYYWRDSISFQIIRRRLAVRWKTKKILYESIYANEHRTYIFWKHLKKKKVLK